MGEPNNEFDRSICFTFYGTYAAQGKRIRKVYGDKMAADYYEAIIDYALSRKPIKNEELMLLVGDTTLQTIDSSQKRRSRGFGEDTDVTRSIIELVRDRPGISQNEIAAEIHCSKGKVNQTLKKFREGKYSDIFDYNIIINGKEYCPNGQIVTDEDESEYEKCTGTNTGDISGGTVSNSNTNINTNSNSTDRYRDHFAGATDTGSVELSRFAPDVADAPGSAAASQKEFEEKIKITKRQEKLNYFQSLKYESDLEDKMLPEICEHKYSNIDFDNNTPEEVREELIKIFTGGFYNAKLEPVTELVDAVIAGKGRL